MFAGSRIVVPAVVVGGGDQDRTFFVEFVDRPPSSKMHPRELEIVLRGHRIRVAHVDRIEATLVDDSRCARCPGLAGQRVLS